MANIFFEKRYIHFLVFYAHRVKFSLYYYNKTVYFILNILFDHATIFWYNKNSFYFMFLCCYLFNGVFWYILFVEYVNYLIKQQFKTIYKL